jgi:hypothetical protein
MPHLDVPLEFGQSHAAQLMAPITAAAGNVITDWDEKAVSVVQTGTAPPPPTAFRTMAILHVAMLGADAEHEAESPMLSPICHAKIRRLAEDAKKRKQHVRLIWIIAGRNADA